MMARTHQQRPHNHRAQHLKQRHPHHNPFRLCQARILALICILTLICFLFPILCQEGSHEALLWSSSHFQSPSPYGIQTPPS
ncbi:hypothetical protein Goklo_006729 [Gossypium klotzschianum]|uniref:Uncharacterized protein n=1 Tax=Gossypium klotzschianum TaxID=34286 RepID=A0A7J8VIL8_9ROSI|nr:hypothetical protein [Gossypium klotzschianum]